MEVNVKDLVAAAAPKEKEDEVGSVATEGMQVAAEEILQAFSAHDKDALISALSNFIKMSQY